MSREDYSSVADRGDAVASQKSLPLVSIITPTLNSERFIVDNVESVRKQTYPCIEHIIVDGASADGTIELVREYNPKAIISSEKDRGISDAFNKGLALAKGEIIAILNSDDYYADAEVVKRIADVFISNADAQWIYGKVKCIDLGTERLLDIYGQPFSLKKMRRKIITPHPAIFARKSFYEAIGPFSLEYNICMDYEYFLKASSRFEPYFLDKVISIMRSGGQSTRNIYRAHLESYRVHRSNGWSAITAGMYLLYGISITAASLVLQRIGMRSLVLFYRGIKGTNR